MNNIKNKNKITCLWFWLKIYEKRNTKHWEE